MRKEFILIVLFLLAFSNILLAQKAKRMSKTELKTKLDSVLTEGNLLYRYEKAAWVSSDLAFGDPTLKSNFNAFFTYEFQGEIKTIISEDGFNTCVAEYVFENDLDKPKSERIEKRELSDTEKSLIAIRNVILEEIFENKHVTYPDDYRPNIILIPFAENYKLYITMGTSLKDVIPFGNDYLFIADKNGKMENWKKFHSRIIPGETMLGTYRVTGMGHTHLITTPLITATEISMFMLYAPLFDMNELSVYSPAIKKSIKYSLKDNKITVK